MKGPSHIPTIGLPTADRSQACSSGRIRRLDSKRPGARHRTALPGLELDEALGPDLVQYAETALATPDGVGGLDDVAGAAVAAAVLDAAEGGDGDGGGAGRGRGGGGGCCWFGHILFIIYYATYAIWLCMRQVSRVVVAMRLGLVGILVPTTNT